MMKKILLAFAMLWSMGLLQVQANTQLDKALPPYSQEYDETRDPFKDAVDAITLAGSTNRNILIEIGGNWCVWCQKMDVFLVDNPDIYQKLHANFVLLKINVSENNDNNAFLKSLPPVAGYPHMFVSTGKGKVMLSKDTGEFIDDDGEHSRQAWLTFIAQWQVSENSNNLKRISAE